MIVMPPRIQCHPFIFHTNITNNPARDYDPSIGPGGYWVAFTSARDGNPEICVIRGNGSDVYNLTRSPG